MGSACAVRDIPPDNTMENKIVNNLRDTRFMGTSIISSLVYTYKQYLCQVIWGESFGFEFHHNPSIFHSYRELEFNQQLLLPVY